jgi:uncharacterized surface protein with fasciclin (FAS1) repeats
VKRSIRTAGLGLAAAALLFGAVACSDDDDTSATTTTAAEATTTTAAEETTTTEAAEEGNTIVDVAVGAGSFTVLVELVTAAGLVDALSGEGPLTVFAPTDEAFEAAAADLGVSLEDLATVLTGDEALLTEILTYHVVDGEVPSSVVVTLNGESVDTLSGDSFVVNVEGETVSITDGAGRNVGVVDVDVEASNGVIHILDNVLLPSLPDLG